MIFQTGSTIILQDESEDPIVWSFGGGRCFTLMVWVTVYFLLKICLRIEEEGMPQKGALLMITRQRGTCSQYFLPGIGPLGSLVFKRPEWQRVEPFRIYLFLVRPDILSCLGQL